MLRRGLLVVLLSALLSPPVALASAPLGTAAASAAVPTEALGGVAELQRDSRQRPQNRYRRPRSSGGDLLCATCSVPH
jgi:hypothetical protein